MTKIIFLDIDGVLNNPGDFRKNRATLNPHCVQRLNTITQATDAEIVISSSWRYMVYGGAMTERGFGYLLNSHGIHIIGITPSDEDVAGRGNQCLAWLSKNNWVTNHIAIDDSDLDMTIPNLNFYQTNGATGLVDEDIEKICSILNG